jgi:hypothetical protein
MASALAHSNIYHNARPSTNGTSSSYGSGNPNTSLSSFPPSRSPSQMSRSPQPPHIDTNQRTSDSNSNGHSKTPSSIVSSQHSSLSAPRKYNSDAHPRRKLKIMWSTSLLRPLTSIEVQSWNISILSQSLGMSICLPS